MSVRYDKRNKHNKATHEAQTKGPCRHCLEEATFRVISVDKPHAQTGNIEKVKMVACTRCLKQCRYNKRFKLIQHPLIKITHFTWQDYVRRTWYRTKRYFLGDHIYGPFKRRRKK